MKKTLGVAIIAACVALGVAGILPAPEANGDEVTVSATVTQTVTCSTAATSTAFGTLTASLIFTSSPNVTSTLACNAALGCALSVQDAGDGAGNAGLWNSVGSDLIASAGATLEAGTEGYGIQADATAAGSGGTLTIAAAYDVSGDTVGALTTTGAELADSSAPISGRQVVVTHKAAISELTAAGSYSDTITYSCTGN